MTRIDAWLWSVRAFKTRSMATAAIKGGHVRLNDAPVKPAHEVHPGDVVTIRTPGWDRVLKVVQPISKRVGAKDAALEMIRVLGADGATYQSVEIHAGDRFTRGERMTLANLCVEAGAKAGLSVKLR